MGCGDSILRRPLTSTVFLYLNDPKVAPGPKTHLRVDFCSFTALWPAGFEPFTMPSRQPSAKPTRAELAGHRPELQSSRLQLPQQPKEGQKVQKKKKENPEIYTFRNFLCSAWVAQP